MAEDTQEQNTQNTVSLESEAVSHDLSKKISPESSNTSSNTNDVPTQNIMIQKKTFKSPKRVILKYLQ